MDDSIILHRISLNWLEKEKAREVNPLKERKRTEKIQKGSWRLAGCPFFEM
jgi:hypothetical protein